ncbi:hypothetical protein CCB80_07305 [Armatimonadetes bacterium Uphvl-Ar1]|nr:hypothetical protein CCB80_07305 [Armatimonadetes bacterium Uphvl-Ar1]
MLTSVVAALVLAQSAPMERPRDIWVFRSVLDENARMLTAALNEKLWVAYDTKTCSLYKAWTGGVKFDGAVYTTVHGPQPTSLGTPYLLNKGATWSFTGSSQPAAVRYLGYRVMGDQLTFKYELTDPTSKAKATVEEVPEFVSAENDEIGLQRTFRITAPANLQLVNQSNFQTTKSKNTLDGPGSFSATGSTLTLTLPSGTATFTSTFPISGTPAGVTQPDGDGDPAPAPAPQQDVSKERVPGLSLRLYYTGISMSEIPELVSGQTPNYSVIIPEVKQGNDGFGSFEDYFLVHVTGFINVTQPGTYEFELGSDDGSRLFIGDNLVVNHDGLHGKSFRAGKTELNAGENPIRIEMFENEADAALELRWKKPGDTTFTPVPASAFSTPAGEVRVTAPGKKSVMGIDNYRPGDKRPLEAVHPAYTLSQARPDSFQPRVGGIDFLPNGDMIVCTWDADGAVYVVKHWDKLQYRQSHQRIAAGLAEPLGIKVVNGRIFVLQKQELTELIDIDRDGTIDEYRCIANGWGVTANFHEFAFGLSYKDGKFYGNLATAINPGGSSTQPQNPDRGRTLEIDPKTGTYRFILSGLRTPNGIGFGAFGKLYISDNQGDWLPSSKIMVVKENAFYGNRSVEPIAKADTPEDPPVVWLPQNEIGNSPSQIAPLNHGPYKNQMVHGDVTHGGLKRVYVEEVNGVLQGTVFRFTQGLESGVNRVVLAPDGSFVIGGIGSSGNWGQTGKLPYGLQRLAYNNTSVFEMLTVSPRRNGLQLTFTEPLSSEVGDSPNYYQVKQWKYVPTVEYGGPKIDEIELKVQSVFVSSDRKSVFLNVDGLKEGHVAYVHTHPSLQSEDKEFIWTTEAWSTINKIPAKDGPVPIRRVEQPTEPAPANDLTSSMDQFTGWNNRPIPAGWTLRGGQLDFTPGVGGGDLKTKDTYSNFDLSFEWRVQEGANSGVFYLAGDDGQSPAWLTAPEYQILHNQKHADGANPMTSAAAMYALYRCENDYTRPFGEWNVGRIVHKDGVIEHYLNHKLMLRVDLNSQEFKDRVAESKFKDMPRFGTLRRGHIVFQDHGDRVSYRKIRIRTS